MTLRPRLCAVAFAVIASTLLHFPASAALTQAELASMRVNPPPGASLPLDAPLTDLDGRTTTLRRVVGDRPAVIVFADYRCTQLCSPILGLAGQAMSKSGLVPGRDYRLIVIGFNPRATRADARAMIGGQIGFDTPVGGATFSLMGDEASIHRLTQAVGYHFVYDEGNARYAHPAALLIVTPDGRLSRVLASLSINGEDARSALIAAQTGGVAGLVDEVRLICYGLGASVGRYTGPVRLLLAATGAATLLAIAAALVLLSRAGARGRA